MLTSIAVQKCVDYTLSLTYIYIDEDKISLLLECTFVNVKSYSIVIQSDPTIMPRIIITKPTIEMIKTFVWDRAIFTGTTGLKAINK